MRTTSYLQMSHADERQAGDRKGKHRSPKKNNSRLESQWAHVASDVENSKTVWSAWDSNPGLLDNIAAHCLTVWEKLFTRDG